MICTYLYFTDLAATIIVRNMYDVYIYSGDVHSIPNKQMLSNAQMQNNKPGINQTSPNPLSTAPKISSLIPCIASNAIE